MPQLVWVVYMKYNIQLWPTQWFNIVIRNVNLVHKYDIFECNCVVAVEEICDVSVDPEKWTIDQTQSWVDWIVHEFDLKSFDVSQFNLTGQQLCSLSKEEFQSRSPPYTGDVLFVHLLILRRGEEHVICLPV